MGITSHNTSISMHMNNIWRQKKHVLWWHWTIYALDIDRFRLSQLYILETLNSDHTSGEAVGAQPFLNEWLLMAAWWAIIAGMARHIYSYAWVQQTETMHAETKCTFMKKNQAFMLNPNMQCTRGQL